MCAILLTIVTCVRVGDTNVRAAAAKIHKIVKCANLYRNAKESGNAILRCTSGIDQHQKSITSRGSPLPTPRLPSLVDIHNALAQGRRGLLPTLMARVHRGWAGGGGGGIFKTSGGEFVFRPIGEHKKEPRSLIATRHDF